MKSSKIPQFICFFLLLLLTAACTSTPSQQPASLQITRWETRNPSVTRNWTINDKATVQQLFQEIHNLPTHQNNGADSCAEPYYRYHLNFLASTKSIEKDDLNTYCFTLLAADGKEYDPTDAFDLELAKMIGVSPNHLSDK